jgi:hypothetical protein
MPRNNVRTGAPIVRGAVWRDATPAGSGQWRGRKRVINGAWRGEEGPPEQAPKDQDPKDQAPPEQARQAKRQRGSETFAHALSGSRSLAITLDGLVGG